MHGVTMKFTEIDITGIDAAIDEKCNAHCI